MNAIWVKTVERTEELSDQIAGKLAKKRAEENIAAGSSQMKSRQRLNLLYLSVSESFYICQSYNVLELHRKLMRCLRESEQDLMESPQSGKSCAKLIQNHLKEWAVCRLFSLIY